MNNKQQVAYMLEQLAKHGDTLEGLKIVILEESTVNHTDEFLEAWKTAVQANTNALQQLAADARNPRVLIPRKEEVNEGESITYVPRDEVLKLIDAAVESAHKLTCVALDSPHWTVIDGIAGVAILDDGSIKITGNEVIVK